MDAQVSRLKDFLTENCIDFLSDEPMCKHTSFKIGGPAELFVMPKNETELISVVDFCKDNDIKHMIVGNGSNLLVSDEGISGAVIHPCGDLCAIKRDEDRVECSCAALLSSLCTFALNSSLSGLEFAYGIPGSVGGAVYMNAGAYGGEMKDVVESVRCYHKETGVITLTIDELRMSYRHSVFCDTDAIILSAVFKLEQGEKESIKEKMDDILFRRKSKQPLNFASAGSTFKRPEGAYAAALIEQCGLKGARVGGACVSEKHSGFIVNDNGATCNDVKNLIDIVKETVEKKTGFSLQCEVIFVE